MEVEDLVLGNIRKCFFCGRFCRDYDAYPLAADNPSKEVICHTCVPFHFPALSVEELKRKSYSDTQRGL